MKIVKWYSNFKADCVYLNCVLMYGCVFVLSIIMCESVCVSL